MPLRTPRWLAGYCKNVLPRLLAAVSGRRLQRTVKAVVKTDRWTSFDRYHDTTQTLADAYEQAGARTDVVAIQTGGQIGTGRWIVQEAADVVAATVDVVRPVRQRLVDYRKDPWQVVRWSTSTPAEGMTNEVVIADTEDDLQRLGRRHVAGKMVLTRATTSRSCRPFADMGAAGVLIEQAIPGHPNATAWTSFGWGGLGVDSVAARLVGLAVSANVGKRLRRLIEKHGRVTLRTRVDIRRYVGTHDLVSGIVRGADDPQDEVWALAHSLEPGALDNASGVAACVEIARIIERLSRNGALPRPKRTIRLLAGYECYSFFHYLEHVDRFQTPLAGVCIDCIGMKPELCDGRLEWHATIPMSAGFVDALGLGVLRAALRLAKPGYRCVPMPFVSTSDTLIGDPKYGFPCPWITTYRGHKARGYDAYHSSADTPELLSPHGTAAITAAMAAYLYFLANADSTHVGKLADWETARTVEPLARSRRRLTPGQAEFIRHRHHLSVNRLRRWLWGGDRAGIMAHLADCERRVRDAVDKRAEPRRRHTIADGFDRVPRRRVPLSPTLENTPEPTRERIREASLPAWALFWADGRRTLADVTDAVSAELDKDVSPDRVRCFFEAHADLGYVDLIEPHDMVSRARIERDLEALGLARGMDVMVHASLSSMGHVIGGPEAVIDALLAVVGKRGTVVMPSFNHYAAVVYNPLTTPTTNGAIADAFWRRPDAVRSVHPSHPVAAVGPKAEALCCSHLEIGIWEQHSPIGRLVHGGGHILCLGATGEPRTAYHIAENAMNCGCIDPFGSVCRMVGPDGRAREVRGMAWRSELCPVSPSKLDVTLDRRKLQRRGKVGRADSTLVVAKDLFDVRREHLKRACPVCKIKPKPRQLPGEMI